MNYFSLIGVTYPLLCRKSSISCVSWNVMFMPAFLSSRVSCHTGSFLSRFATIIAAGFPIIPIVDRIFLMSLYFGESVYIVLYFCLVSSSTSSLSFSTKLFSSSPSFFCSFSMVFLLWTSISAIDSVEVMASMHSEVNP